MLKSRVVWRERALEGVGRRAKEGKGDSRGRNGDECLGERCTVHVVVVGSEGSDA